MRVRTKIKDSQLIVKVKTSFSERIKIDELERFQNAQLRGFLKPKKIKRNGAEYTGPVGVSLYERFTQPITKKEFLSVIEYVVVAIHKLTTSSFLVENMSLDLKRIYINESTKEVQFLYVPLNEYKDPVNILEFIQTIVYSVNPTQIEDTEYLTRFSILLQSMKRFDGQRVERYIEKEDKAIVDQIKKLYVGQSGYITNRNNKYTQEENADQDMLATGDMENASTGLLQSNDVVDPTEEFNEDKTGLLKDTLELTCMENAEGYSFSHPTLYRISNNDSVKVNKPVFRLGRGENYVDYYVDNMYIGKCHADIITRGNRFYIKDLNSRNHTFVNNLQIASQLEVEIFDNCNLRLANEEFVFHIQ